MISENPELPPVHSYWSPFGRSAWAKLKFETPDDLRDFATQVRALSLVYPGQTKQLWVTVEKTLEERRFNTTLQRVYDVITTEDPTLEVEICRNGGKIWTNKSEDQPIGTMNRRTERFDWNDPGLTAAGVTLTDEVRRQVNEYPKN